jgi:hypothetical protein
LLRPLNSAEKRNANLPRFRLRHAARWSAHPRNIIEEESGHAAQELRTWEKSVKKVPIYSCPTTRDTYEKVAKALSDAMELDT